MCRLMIWSDSGPGVSRLTKRRAVISMASGSRPALRSGLADDRHGLRDVLGRVPVDDDAVADLAGDLEHAGTQRRDVDGHGRVGHLRQPEAVHRDRLALEDDALAGERRAEELRHLAHARGGLGEHAAVPRFHDRLRARADAEDEAPRGEVREPGGRGGERRGAARVDVGDRDAEPHARGGGGDRGQRREAVHAVHLERPRVRVAQPLRLAGDVAQLGDRKALHRHRQRPPFLGHGGTVYPLSPRAARW